MVQNSDLLHRMQHQIEAWKKVEDRRAIFLECYTIMTSNMLQAINDRRFHDGRWTKQLLLRFADYYFQSLDGYDRKTGPCTNVWSFTHDCACGRKLHVLQHLLLGINAHINYDLVLSLVDILEPEWDRLSDNERRIRYRDHCMVNEVIAATIDKVQDEVVERYDPSMDWIDRLLGRLDERMLSGLITRWRGEVWEKAMLLLKANSSQRETLREKLEDSVLERANWILLV